MMWTMRSVALAAVVLLVAQQDTSSRIGAEIERTRTAVSTSVAEQQRAGALARLDRASKAVPPAVRSWPSTSSNRRGR